MSIKSHTLCVSAPGKLMLSGEWGVLEPGNSSLVTAIDRRVFAELGPSEKFSVCLDDYLIETDFDWRDGKLKPCKELLPEQHEKLRFVVQALTLCLSLFEHPKPFRLHTWGKDMELEHEGHKHKVGFGSSAAATTATIAAVLAFYGEDIETYATKLRVFKLASLAHYLAQGKLGSGFDIAASTFGGALHYARCDPTWVESQLKHSHGHLELLPEKWPKLVLEPIEWPSHWRLLIGWTGSSASTTTLVKAMKEWQKKCPEQHAEYFQTIGSLAAKVIHAWKDKDEEQVSQLLRENEVLLRDLGKASGVPIETERLKQLSEIAAKHGTPGKLSGAGGGDCGIAICFDDSKTDQIVKAWKMAGIVPLDVQRAEVGIRVEK